MFEQIIKDRRRGYARAAVSFYEQGAIHFAFWATKQHLDATQISDGHVANFLSRHLPRCHCPLAGVRKHQTVRAAVVHFEAALRSAGTRRRVRPSLMFLLRDPAL